jgi:hypothetical protein
MCGALALLGCSDREAEVEASPVANNPPWLGTRGLIDAFSAISHCTCGARLAQAHCGVRPGACQPLLRHSLTALKVSFYAAVPSITNFPSPFSLLRHHQIFGQPSASCLASHRSGCICQVRISSTPIFLSLKRLLEPSSRFASPDKGRKQAT